MKRASILLFLSLTCTAGAVPAFAASPAAGYFKDIVLTDQNGHRVRLYDDVMKDRTVVMSSFFASCKGSCPIVARTYSALQKEFSDHLEKDLVFVSITVDPGNDTPARLAEYARNVKAQPGWFLLTGSPEEVTRALKKIGQFVEKPEAHVNVMLVGNDRTGLWKKVLALAPSAEIAVILRSVLDDRGDPATPTFPGQ